MIKLLSPGSREGRRKRNVPGHAKVGTNVTFFGGNNKVRWHILEANTYPCASVMLMTEGFKRFDPEARSFEDALRTYCECYATNYSNNWSYQQVEAWNERCRTDKDEFVSWRGEPVESRIDVCDDHSVNHMYLSVIHMYLSN